MSTPLDCLLAQESVVEKSDYPALVLGGPRRDPGDMLAVRDFPDLLRLSGRGVEGLVRPSFSAALATLAVDEEHVRRRDPRGLALQARGRKPVREDGERGGECELRRQIQEPADNPGFAS